MSTSTPISRDPAVPADSLVAWIVERLIGTRRRLLYARWFAAVCCAALLMVSFVALLAVVDFFAELPFIARAVAICCLVASVAAGGYLFYRRRVVPLTLSNAAAEAEWRVSSFGQRLRTMLDYQKPEAAPAPASLALLAAMHQQTDELARRVEWETIVDTRPAIGAFAAAVATVMAWCVALVAVPEYRTATARALLLPAEYTQVDYTPHEQTVRSGDAAQVEVTIRGRPARVGHVRYRAVGSTEADWTTIELGRSIKSGEAAQASAAECQAALVGTFSAGIENLQHDLELEVVAGPRPLLPGRIAVLQPLVIEKVATHVVPPHYTGRPDETGESLEPRVLEGSNVELRLELNRPAAEATLADEVPASGKTASSAGALLPVKLSEKSLVVTLRDLRQSASYTIRARAADGMSLEPTPLRIRVVLDRKPEIKFLSPPEELTVVPTAEVPIVAEASDDLGLYKVGIQYRLDDGELQTLWEGSGDGSTDSLRAAAVLMLEDLHVTFRNAISYYAYAEDNYFGEPRRTTSELRFIDIRPFKVEYQMIDSEGGCCNGGCLSLEALIKSQRANLAAAFAERQSSPSAQKAEDLRRAEAELQSQTQAFTDGMKARVGPLPVLDDAVFAMGQAVEQFSRQAIGEAIEYEQQALVDLLQARENLRQIFKNSSQASNCRKFDRELQQKLRRPEKKDAGKEQLAKARKKLGELAERERKWGQQAQQCCNSGSARGSPQAQEAQPPSKQASQESGSSKSAQAPSAQELVAAQDALRNELQTLKQDLAALDEAGSAAQKQAQRADEAMQQGREKLGAHDGAGAAKAADNSAETLEQLADQLAALASQDFGQRLDLARRQAEQLADREGSLARQLAAAATNPDGKLGSEQKSLAARAEMLAELIEALRRDSAADTASARRRLESAAGNTPPREIAKAMEQAAAEIKEGRMGQAARRADDAGARMDELAKALKAAHADFAQPRLDELVALEEQLAELIEQAERVQQGAAGGKAGLARKWETLAAKLARLAESDQRLAGALGRMEFRPNENHTLPQGHFSWIEWGDIEGPRKVAKALQAKIQEAILAGALTDADQPVPPEYKPLVEKYYKTLSDDLR